MAVVANSSRSPGRSRVRHRLKPRLALLSGVVLVATATVALASGAAQAAEAPVGLGTAKSYSVLAGSTVTNTGPTVINGDVGLSPGSSVTGFSSSTASGPGQIFGDLHVADAEAAQAKTDLTTAYNDAAGRGPGAAVTADLGGRAGTGARRLHGHDVHGTHRSPHPQRQG